MFNRQIGLHADYCVREGVVSKWSSRKFWTMATCQVFACAALFFDKMTGSEWVAATTILAGAYLAANVAEKAVVR